MPNELEDNLARPPALRLYRRDIPPFASVILNPRALELGQAFDIPKLLSMDGMSKYQHRPLTGDEIRLIKLQPGDFTDDLYAEIGHCRLETASPDSEQSLLLITEIDKTLPQGWRSFRTPEGKLLYQEVGTPASRQYHHPLQNSLPEELREALQLDASRPSQTNIVEGQTQF